MKASGNDIIVQVKGNQAQLLDDCQIVTRTELPKDSFESPAEKGHGRIETRSCRVFDLPYTTDPEWQGLANQIIEIKRIREVKHTKTKEWVKSEETAFFISTTQKSAQEYHEIIRKHWAIENKNHHVRDQTLYEDNSRIRKNPIVKATLKSFALNIFGANNVTNIKQKLYENALNFNRLKKLKGVFV